RNVVKFGFGRPFHWLFGTKIPCTIQEAYGIGHNFRGLSPDSILIFIGANLQAPFHGYETALGQMIGADLGLLPPGYDVNEISFPLATLVQKGAIHCKREVGYRDPSLSVAQLWVGYQSPDEDDPIQHPSSLLCSFYVSSNEQITHDFIGDLENTFDLGSRSAFCFKIDHHVEAFGVFLDLVSEPAFPPLVNFFHFAAHTYDQLFRPLYLGRQCFLVKLWAIPYHQLILTHRSFTSPLDKWP